MSYDLLFRTRIVIKETITDHEDRKMKNCFSVELWMSRMVWSIQYATNTPRMFKTPARKICLHRVVTPPIIVQQNTIQQIY